MNGFTTIELTLYGIAALVFLFFNAICVATEFSLVKLRFTRFGTARMVAARQRSDIAALLDSLGKTLKLLRLGVSLSSVATAFSLLPLVLTLVRDLDWAPSWPLRCAILISLFVAVGLHFVLGELIPRSMALQRPVQTLRFSIPFVSLFRTLSKPFAVVLYGLSGFLLKVLRMDAKVDLELLDVQAQIRSLVKDGEELTPLAESIVSNALEFRKRVAHDIMIPRNQLQYIDLEDSVTENLKTARETGHTRFPLCKEGLDNCVGIIHIKDVFRSGKPASEIDWMKLRRPMIRFSMDERLDRVLQRFLKTKKHFGLLTDEFGGTVGAVTMEDVLEELVGEIQDEFDRDEERISDVGDGLFEVDGLTPLHDLAESMGISLEAAEVSTVGGYVTFELGRLPRKGEVFRLGDLEFTAAAVDERRVMMVTVRVVRPTLPEGEDD